MPTGLTEAVYRISLEHPGHWAFFFGMGGDASLMIEGLRVERLDAFIHGYQHAIRDLGVVDTEAREFFEWLRLKLGWSSKGWLRDFQAGTNGDDQRAIQMFFEHLHAFVLERKPGWFIEFNRAPMPSLTGNGLGTPYTADVRLPAHVLAATT